MTYTRIIRKKISIFPGTDTDALIRPKVRISLAVFVTHLIYFFFIRNVLPFGLRNTSSIFQRLMGVCKRKEDLNDIHKNKFKKNTNKKRVDPMQEFF